MAQVDRGNLVVSPGHVGARPNGNWRAILTAYDELLAGTVPVSRAVAILAVELREASGRRLPAVDATIAAAAHSQGFTLVHRDKHLDLLAGGPVKLMRL